MIKLNTNFSRTERKTIRRCADNTIKILPELNKKCYLLNYYGELTFEECFGKTNNTIISEQKYKEAKPHRILKYYQYYLIEDRDNLGEWYIGREYKNGAIEGESCCETLQFAFEIL